FNRLVERERAIVTAQPGTTRDLVSETVSIGGIPVELVDTAGIRRAPDDAEAESIGIKKSIEALADADLVLVVIDKSQPLSEEDHELLTQVEGRQTIVVENKSDLLGTGNVHVGKAALGRPAERSSAASCEATSCWDGALPRPSRAEPGRPLPQHIATSALTGEGIPALRAAILHRAA